MTDIEFDFVVHDTLAALETYRKVFDIELVKKTGLERGQNEVLFSIYGCKFHMLDENPDCGLTAPKEGQGGFCWFNITVEDIGATFARAEKAGFTAICPVREMPGMGLKNAVLLDPYGYTFMLHQVL